MALTKGYENAAAKVKGSRDAHNGTYGQRMFKEEPPTASRLCERGRIRHRSDETAGGLVLRTLDTA